MKSLVFSAIVFGVIVGLFLFIGQLVDESVEKGVIFSDGEERVVTKIIDGDTVVVEGGETIRLIGIDCDERGKECYSAAKNYIEEVLLDKLVVLESEDEDKDMYGRSLRYIFLDGENVNVRLVKEGYCVARIYSETKYKGEIQIAEQEAIDNNVGCKWE